MNYPDLIEYLGNALVSSEKKNNEPLASLMTAADLLAYVIKETIPDDQQEDAIRSAYIRTANAINRGLKPKH